MSRSFATLCAVVACICAGITMAFAARAHLERKTRLARRRRMLHGSDGSKQGSSHATDDRVLGYAENLTRRLFVGETEPLTPSVRKKRAGETRAGARYRERALSAGCSKRVTVSAFCEARTRLTAVGAAAGAVLGIMISNELAVVLCLVGAFVARSLPMRSVNGAARKRTVEAEQHLSEMLEVVALGLRSGLTFDRSFALYGSHFSNGLARSCTKAHRQWSLGLLTREEALRELSDSYDCEQLARVVDSIIRGLRFGTALAESLEESAVQARENYRSKLAERVAKAPVKMMLPTGTLILPSMLLLVMGPIVIELTSGF